MGLLTRLRIATALVPLFTLNPQQQLVNHGILREENKLRSGPGIQYSYLYPYPFKGSVWLYMVVELRMLCCRETF